jgi:hypothetical protein
VHPFDNRVNSGEGEDIFDRDSVYFPIIEYGTVTSILLFDEKDGGRVWGFRFSDQAGVFLFLNVLRLEFLLSLG